MEEMAGRAVLRQRERGMQVQKKRDHKALPCLNIEILKCVSRVVRKEGLLLAGELDVPP